MIPALALLIPRLPLRRLLLAVGWLGLFVSAFAVDAPLVVDGPALLKEWTPPVYPSAALKARRSGMVNVRLIVDDTGKVTQARALEDSDEEFAASAIAAVRTWIFEPALDSGKPAACCLETLVTYSPAVGQQKAPADRRPPKDQSFIVPPRTSPKPKSAPEGEYPAALTDRKLPGLARFACIVLPDGRATEVRVTAASHVDFVLPVLRAVRQWEFEPGMQGDLPIRMPTEGQMSFDAIAGEASEVLAANGITMPDGSAPAFALRPLGVADPVWPLEALLKGEGGAATVEFTVGPNGSVSDVRVREATQPEFGRALQAAMESSSFARLVNRTSGVTLVKRTEFTAVPLDATADGDPTTRLVVALRANTIGSAKGLDGKLTPIYRVAPVYPEALHAGERPAGRAEIEFVIDREGRARLPRVVSATHEEFGWAAATAVAQWVFEAPRRGGEPVDVKVRIPVTFAPPAD